MTESKAREFDHELASKMMHEFAMQNLGEAQRLIFESASDESLKELFKENLAAGQGFYQGARWQFDKLQAELKAKDELLRECEEAIRHMHYCKYWMKKDHKDCDCNMHLIVKKLREGKE